MYGCKNIILNKSFGDEHGVLIVISFPSHESHEDVLSKCYLSLVDGRTVCYDFTFFNSVPLVYEWQLIDAGALVRSRELDEPVDIICSVIGGDDYPVCLHHLYCSCASCLYKDSGVICCLSFDSGAYYC